MNYNSYYTYTWRSQYTPHGPVHIWIGGTMDCKVHMVFNVGILVSVLSAFLKVTHKWTRVITKQEKARGIAPHVHANIFTKVIY